MNEEPITKQEERKFGPDWLLDRNSRFRSAFNLGVNILLVALIIVFIFDYDNAKNSYQFSQVMQGISACRGYPFVYLILSENNVDRWVNGTPEIVGFHCTTELDTLNSTLGLGNWSLVKTTWPGITPSPTR